MPARVAPALQPVGRFRLSSPLVKAAAGGHARVRKVHHNYSDAGLLRLASYESLNTSGESSATHREFDSKRDKAQDKLLDRLANGLPIAIGLSLALLTQAMVSAESLIHHAMHLIDAMTMESCSMRQCSVATWISAGAAFIAVRMLVVLVAALLTAWEPNAAGSGMSAVKSNLNGADITNYLTARTLFAKSVGEALTYLPTRLSSALISLPHSALLPLYLARCSTLSLYSFVYTPTL